MTKNSRSVGEEDNKKSRVEMVVDEFWNWNNGDVIRFESLNKRDVDLQFSKDFRIVPKNRKYLIPSDSYRDLIEF